MQNYIGQRKYADATEMKDVYMSLGRRNEDAAILLEKQALYNEAVYMYIQAMEKKIKGYICGKVDSSNPYFSQKLRDIGHSLDMSIEFLIELLAGSDEILKNQLSIQIKSNVFQDIKFSRLYNDCRYPYFNAGKNSYFTLSVNKEDCARVAEINKKLDNFIVSFDRI